MPADLVELGAMEDAEYADAFTLTEHGCPGHSAEQWARAMVEKVVGVQAQLLWRVVMRLRLRPRWKRRPGQVAGWPIDGQGPDWLRLAAHSGAYSFHLVVRADDETVSLATFARYRTEGGRRRWNKLSAKHRSLAPGLLRGAAAVLSRTP